MSKTANLVVERGRIRMDYVGPGLHPISFAGYGFAEGHSIINVSCGRHRLPVACERMWL